MADRHRGNERRELHVRQVQVPAHLRRDRRRLTPLFLVAGTFFPLSQLPEWAQVLGNLSPLHHTVELIRHAVFGWDDLVSACALIGFGVLMWRVTTFATVNFEPPFAHTWLPPA
jgi:hypothetical protein